MISIGPSKDKVVVVAVQLKLQPCGGVLITLLCYHLASFDSLPPRHPYGLHCQLAYLRAKRLHEMGVRIYDEHT